MGVLVTTALVPGFYMMALILGNSHVRIIKLGTSMAYRLRLRSSQNRTDLEGPDIDAMSCHVRLCARLADLASKTT